MAIRVFVVDEASVTVNGLEQILKPEKNIDLVGASTNPLTAIEAINQLEPNIVLMEIQYSDIEAVDLLADINEMGGKIHVVGYSAIDDENSVKAFVQAGASGYVLKRNSPNRLVEAIQLVANGRTWFAPEIAHLALLGKKPKNLEELGLSKREVQVFQLLVNGLSNPEIADELVITEGTVKNHVSNIYRKLGFSGRAKVIRWAAEQGHLD